MRSNSSTRAATATPADIDNCCPTLAKLVALLMSLSSMSAYASELTAVNSNDLKKPPTSSTAMITALGVAALPALALFADTSVANLLQCCRSHPRARFTQPIEWIFDDLAPARYVARLPRVPLLFVYGRRDAIAPPHHGRRLYARAKGAKEWQLVRGASHLSLTFAEETAKRVGEWFACRLGLPANAAAGEQGTRPGPPQ